MGPYSAAHGVSRRVTATLSPTCNQWPLSSSGGVCVCAAGLQSSPHPDFSVRNVVLPKPWAVKRHQVLVGVVQNSLDASRVAGHDPRVVQPCWRAAEGRESNRLHHSPKSLHEPCCTYCGFGCLCLPCRTAELKLWQALQCCPCWPSHTHL